MNQFKDRIHRAANLLANGVCRLEVADLLKEDGADLSEAILTVIAAEQYLKDFNPETQS